MKRIVIANIESGFQKRECKTQSKKDCSCHSNSHNNFNQNNKIKSFIIYNETSFNNPLQQLVNIINQDNIILDEFEIGFINFYDDEQRIIQYLFGPGKGSYGLNGILVTTDMFVRVEHLQLSTAITDNSLGSNGTDIISSDVKIISFYNEHFKLIDSPYNISNIIGGHTVLSLSDDFIESLIRTGDFSTFLIGSITDSNSAASTLSLNANNFENYYTFLGTTTTWTVPIIGGNYKKKITVINQGSGIITLNSNLGGNDFLLSGTLVNTINISSGEILLLYNNGIKWCVL